MGADTWALTMAIPDKADPDTARAIARVAFDQWRLQVAALGMVPCGMPTVTMHNRFGVRYAGEQRMWLVSGKAKPGVNNAKKRAARPSVMRRRTALP